MPLDIAIVPQWERRLGRQKVHDSRSREYVAPRGTPYRLAWVDKAVRLYDPLPNPNQCHGECTACAEAMMLNQKGNRVTGRVLSLLGDAHQLYAWASHNDPWPGGWPEEDTGSSGLAAAKAAVHYGLATEYLWEFGGADGIVQQVQEGRAMSVGTWWHADMFGPSGGHYAGLPVFRPTGGVVGGHQYVARGYDAGRDMVLCRTWWGQVRDFWIQRADLDYLVRDGGDAHFTRSVASKR